MWQKPLGGGNNESPNKLNVPLATAQSAPLQNLQSKSQSVKLSGKVVDSTGEPIIGATITENGTKNVTVTDIDGNFTINAKSSNATVTVTYVGFNSKQVKLAAGRVTDITLSEDSHSLEELVVVGYGTTSKRKTTSAISSVNSEDIAKVPVPNITQSLAGRAPGLIVQQSGGGVNAKASISIRGGGTPLYVIDNVICEERDFQNLNTDDIDQISVLKDASATAIYGARAANGYYHGDHKEGCLWPPQHRLQLQLYTFTACRPAGQGRLLYSRHIRQPRFGVRRTFAAVHSRRP